MKPLSLERVTCTTCGAMMLQSALKPHMERKHGAGVFKCNLCEFTANAQIKVSFSQYFLVNLFLTNFYCFIYNSNNIIICRKKLITYRSILFFKVIPKAFIV